MSNEIKVGDICVIVNSADAWNGLECEVVSPLSVGLVREVGSTTVRRRAVFGVLVAGYAGMFSVERDQLRKKPPKADESEWIRQETIPRQQFDTWLDKVREQQPVKVYS